LESTDRERVHAILLRVQLSGLSVSADHKRYLDLAMFPGDAVRRGNDRSARFLMNTLLLSLRAKDHEVSRAFDSGFAILPGGEIGRERGDALEEVLGAGSEIEDHRLLGLSAARGRRLGKVKLLWQLFGVSW
jgi:hypothetical protein